MSVREEGDFTDGNPCANIIITQLVLIAIEIRVEKICLLVYHLNETKYMCHIEGPVNFDTHFNFKT
jgi:hypothetical protein